MPALLDPTEHPPKTLLGRLLPLFTILLLILVGGLWGLLGWMQEQRLREIVANDLSEVTHKLDVVLAEQSAWLAALLEPIGADALTREALRAHDRERLLQRWQGLFEVLGARNGLSHFYFISADRHCLLRVHQPPRYGDRIDRHTLREAEHSGHIAAGIELGPLGTFTLRVVKPLDVAGERLGYLELGKEIEDVLAMLHAREGIELAVLIHKSRLDRARWESGMQMLDRQPEWERFPHSVVVHSSLGRLPDAFWRLVTDHDQQLEGGIDRGTEIEFDHRRWRATLQPLSDVAGDHVGNLLILRDLSAEVASFRQQTRQAGLITLVLLIGVLGLSALLLARTDRLVARQQAALAQREAWLRATLNSISEGVICSDADGAISELNPAAERLTGWARDEACGQALYSVIQLCTPGRNAEALLDTASAPQLLARDGRRLAVAVSQAPIRTHSGQQLGIVIVVRDISEDQRIREQLARSREQYMLAVDNSSDGIWDWNRTTRELFLSPRWKQQLGYSDQEFPNRIESFLEHIHPEDRPRVMRALAHYLRGNSGPTFSLEYRLRHKDGSWRWILARGGALRDARARAYRMAGSHTDVTEQHAARQTMSALNAVIEHSDAIVVVKDLDLRVIAANPTFAQLTGHASVDELLGKTDAEIFGCPPDAEPVCTYMSDERRAQHLAPGEIILREEPVQHSDGQTRTFLTKKYPIFDASGTLIATGNISVDISLRKHTEERLLKTNEALSVSMSQARELARRAEQASEAKTLFLSNMSHEIRTPLNGVIGMLGLLEHTRLDSEQRGYVEIARSSGESLLRIVNDILDFSKIEAGKLELEHIEFELCELLDTLASSLALPAHAKGLEFLCALAPDVPTRLHGDPGRLSQVLTNLAGNAVKFTTEGEVVVWVEARALTTRQVQLRICVRDTGPGIPEHKRSQLFQSFSQLDPSHSRQFGGTGLGLAISRQLVELMGGTIGVESHPGEGSEFWFEVSFGRATGVPERQPDGFAQGLAVLIIDDNATHRDILRTRLASWGCRVRDTDCSAQRVLAILHRAHQEHDPIELVLIAERTHAPETPSLSARIREDANCAGITVVCLSPLGAHARDWQQRGCCTQLTKPVRMQELRGLIETLLDHTQGLAPAPDAGAIAIAPEPPTAASSARILLADDNRTNQLVALGQLRHLGYQAESVDDGQQVLDALAANHYDLLLLDVQMPGMDGFETTHRIRARNSRLPIVAMTAHALESDRLRCLAAGMDDYLTKPLDPEMLARVLQQWLAHRTQDSGPLPAQTDRQESTPPVFDRARLLSQMMGDEALAQIAVETFFKDLPNQMQRFGEAVEHDDASAAAQQAHALKGAAASIGALALAAVAGAVEHTCREQHIGRAALRAHLDTLEQTVATLCRQCAAPDHATPEHAGAVSNPGDRSHV